MSSEVQQKANQIALLYMEAIAEEELGSELSMAVVKDFYTFSQAVEKLSNGEAKAREADAKEKELAIRQQEADCKLVEVKTKAEELEVKKLEANIRAQQVANELAKWQKEATLKMEELGVKRLEVTSRQKTEIKRARWEGGKFLGACAASTGLTIFCTFASEKGWFTNKAGLAQVPKVRF